MMYVTGKNGIFSGTVGIFPHVSTSLQLLTAVCIYLCVMLEFYLMNKYRFK